MSNTAGPTSGSAASAWAPFRHWTFTVLWTATVVANIGTWMYNAASGWLMTSLNPAPLTVSLVQVATTLPMFLFAVPAGALADIFRQTQIPDRCRGCGNGHLGGLCRASGA
jgi:MFS family permease